ncbi:stationary phase survival protein SurE [Clostridium carboxidivorans P7]|uniref:5'-nucleotidase SurE n=1 Tax=Clostridium carboxidivorans P7 TaxID=536227 RepID=C6PND3_9CLOT|nr:5'/3'-nucleotidase SurE [Clostridium carboxidivorans]AKN33583.1 stationary phase survival protein SurE [Clostridium carboxidivorans P7]EET89254.1 stationary-phase survival protein SurE [Clostridium carboxidivorans P7]EFG86831.1 5'/3'-nucleotidase SurE [Clostridium carboxidivorans P7]
MKLLLTNDDGVNAKGIYTLAKELEKNHEIIIVAPSVERSACSHSITMREPLIVKEVKLNGIKSKAYSVSGTPADCVKVAVNKLTDGKVDMVLSGINNGVNAGIDVLYSGTVSAAIEAAIYKIPSMAVSSEIEGGEDNYEVAAKYASDLIEKIKNKYLKDDVVWNLNVPILNKEKIKGIKICRIGGRTYNSYFEENAIDDGKSFQLRGELNNVQDIDTDVHFIKQGYVTVTPLHYDLTNFKILEEVRKLF